MVKLRFDTDLGSTLKGVADLNTKFDKLGDTVETTTKGMNALERAGKRLVDANLTPQERYNQKMETLAKAVKSGAIQMAEAERTAGRMRQRLDDATKSSGGLFGPAMLSNIGSYVAGIASASAALSLFRSELDAVRKEAERITQSQLEAGPARDVLKRNIAGMGPKRAAGVERRAEALAAQLGLPQAKIDVALAEAYSASGGDVEAAFNQVRAAGQFLKSAPEQIGTFSGSLGDISKGTGDPNAMRNLGFMIRIGAMSRVADAQKQAKSIPQALAGARAFQATGEQSGALFAALSVAAADIEGNISGTGTIRTAEQLKGFFDKQVKDKKFQSAAVDTFAERLGELRKSPELARQFIDKASFEAKVKGPLQQFFLDPNSAMARAYESNLQQFGTAAQQQATAHETIGYLGQGRFAATGATERAITSKVEQFRLGREAQLTAESREAIIERVARLNMQFLFQARLGVLGQTGLTMSPEEAIGQLESSLGAAQRGVFRPEVELIQNTKEMVTELKAIRERVKGSAAPKPSGRQE
ncbi:MAG: hypothetical protein WD738_23925 [Pirellulales bacterium]